MGKATLHIENHTGADKLYLDTRYLTINNVTLNDEEKATFILGDQVEFLGQPLIIDISRTTKTVTIR